MKYGMGAARLARQMAMPISAAGQLVVCHRAAFPTFWLWSEAVENHALLHGEQTTVFGWRIAIAADANPRGA
jgi:DNA polymerase I-like protein with 3'-5' exonuclease and polymerase domains